MKTIFSSVVLCVSLTSCWWLLHDVRPPYYSPVIFLVNTRGLDLLDSATMGHYYKDSIKLHWKGDSVIFPPSICHPLAPNSGLPNYWPRACHYWGPGPLQRDTLIIRLNRLDYDTMYFWPSNENVKKIFYNKQLLAPPAGMSQYPLHDSFVLTVVKSN